MPPCQLPFIRASEAAAASDWHLVPGQPLRVRLAGDVRQVSDVLITEADIKTVRELAPRDDDDLEVAIGGHGTRRFRVHHLSAMGRSCAVLRIVAARPPTLDSITGLPPAFRQLLTARKGLVLVGGPTGCGKSTTVAACIDWLNNDGGRVICTREDPIEFIHTASNDTVIFQEEYRVDFQSWPDAIRSAMREDPDVIFVAEMRDPETIEAALRAAETGHLVFATVHGGSPVSMIDRIISAHQGAHRETIAALIASNCIGLLAQDLVPAVGGGRRAIFEFAAVTAAMAATIRENRLHQLRASIVSGRREGMLTFDDHVAQLLRNGHITHATARQYHTKPDDLPLTK